MQFIPRQKKLEKKKKPIRHRFLIHCGILIWKCYYQRRRRWGLLIVEGIFALLLFLVSIFIAKPVFLTPLQDEPSPPMGSADVLSALRQDSILGYAPNIIPYATIMEKAIELLDTENMLSAATEDDLNEMLYNISGGKPLQVPVIWVIWKPKDVNIWAFSIRSTERARFSAGRAANHGHSHGDSNKPYDAGFLAVQMAISQAIVQFASKIEPDYEVTLFAMPVSPLMEADKVRSILSGILLCFTLALMPPVLEAQALVVTETRNKFKRALRLRNVEYTSMYVSWLVYAYLTCLPTCVLASVTIILIFRWIHLVEALLVVLAYISVMIMIAYVMGMFHSKATIACIWTILFIIFQSYISELLVHHQYDQVKALTFLWHLILPPMGLLHAFHKFALLQTEHKEAETDTSSLLYMVSSWSMMNVFYFVLLMLLQRTLGQDRAIGGQVTWKSVIFQKAKNRHELRKIKGPAQGNFEKLQKVDEFLAIAVSFRDVSKSIMGVPVLEDIAFDLYRGEFAILYTERIQDSMLRTIDDLLTGLTTADQGSVIVLGKKLKPGAGMMTTPQMMGYCHRSETLIDDLSVQEHFALYSVICLWNEQDIERKEYTHIRYRRLLKECDLESVRHERVRNLNIYYKAQLCWAMAMFLEPRIIVIPEITEHGIYKSVIEDKIMEHKQHKTIVLYSTMRAKLEYADRVFIFDTKQLVFGGTPAYMFFKYGREYRLQLTIKADESLEEQQELLDRLALAEATVRAHLGYLIIARVPVNPSSQVAELIKDLTDNANKYGVTSFDISVPDTREVCNRARSDFRASWYKYDALIGSKSKEALIKMTEPVKWKRQTSFFSTHFCWIFSKFFMFHKNNKRAVAVTFLAAVITGVGLGFSIPSLLLHLDPAEKVLRSQDLTEYLVLRAIDSPQKYVYMYAYGMDVFTNENGIVEVKALYSPIHYDQSAQARSLARVYMALLRHYTGALDATIKVDDDPLTLDLSWSIADLVDPCPPLFVQLLIILTIWHMTFIPSLENGLIRHYQKHAMNYSPLRYWFTLYFCDLLLFWLLVVVMCSIMIVIMVATVPTSQFDLIDFFIVPIMLAVYGIGCVPQAYIFSLGPWVAINVVTYVTFNLVFGETTVLAKIFYGDAFSYVLSFMTLSPQFNIAYAYVKIKRIFLYNNECYIFKAKNLCLENKFHTCCEKCGLLQECFSRKSYFNKDPGIILEMSAMFTIAMFFTALLLLIEYRIFHRLWYVAFPKAASNTSRDSETALPTGSDEERRSVQKNIPWCQHSGRQISEHFANNKGIPNIGECLLASNVSKKEKDEYMVHRVYLEIGKGEALAVAGHKSHGRSLLCQILAGYKSPDYGDIWAMSKYPLKSQPHRYSQQVSITCEEKVLPPWMKAFDALSLIAALRGVPQCYIHEEVTNHFAALELNHIKNCTICNIPTVDRTRLKFAAAVIGAPPVIILDDCIAFQKFSVRRAMYSILYSLRKRGHAIIVASGSTGSGLPLTDRLAILQGGTIFDVDTVDNLIGRYGEKGFTVVVHLKNEVDIHSMFAKYFTSFVVNDTSEVLVNVQIKDTNLRWAGLFEKMETLKAENQEVYSYIAATIPIDHIYNSITSREPEFVTVKRMFSWKWLRKIMSIKAQIMPNPKALSKLVKLERKYGITKLKELPWSVIFHR